MPRVDKAHQPGLRFQETHPRGDEHLRVVALAQHDVGVAENVGRRVPALGVIVDQRLPGHHEHRGGNPLAADVRDQKTQPVLVQQVEIVEIPADLLRRVHGGVEAEVLPVRIGRKHARQRGLLDVLRESQFLVNPGSRRRDILLQRAHRRVDIVRQGRKFRVAAHVHHFVQVAFRNAGQRMVDPVDIADHQFPDQQVDHHKQRDENHDHQRRAQRHRRIPLHHDLILRDHRYNQITLGKAVQAAAGDVVHRLLKNLVLRHRLRIDPKPGNLQVLPFVPERITDDGPVPVADQHKAAPPHMPVMGYAHHRPVHVLLEARRVVSHLDKSSVDGDSAVFPGDGGIVGNRLIVLNDFRCRSVHQRHEFRRLFAALHVESDKVRIRAGDDDPVSVHQVDFRHVVLLTQLLQPFGRCIQPVVQRVRNLVGQLRQVLVARVQNILLHVLDVDPQQLRRVLVGQPRLQHPGEADGSNKADQHDDQQARQKAAGNRLFPCFLHPVPHSMVVRSVKPVISKMLMIFGLTFRIIIVPWRLIAFWADSSTRNPVEEM